MRKNPTNSRESDLEREIRSQRKFNMSEAIARAGGAELLKGASPVTLKRQAELEIALYLESHLVGSGVPFENVLVRHVADSALLLEQGYEKPLCALKCVIDRLLRSEERLREFVRQIDAEWGRINQERPHFDRKGKPPSPDDPYTIASVQKSLSQLMSDLSSA